MRMRTTPTLLLVLGLVAVPAIASVQSPKDAAPAAQAAAATSRTVVGDVVAVDSASRGVTVKEGNKEAAYTLAADAVIQSAGKTVGLADLKAGQHVKLTMPKDSSTVSRLEILPAGPTS